MHGTFKKTKEVHKAPDPEPKTQEMPDLIGPDWWIFKALHDPCRDPLQQFLSTSSQ